MGTYQIHLTSEERPEWLRKINYGQCTVGSRADQGLWFVNMWVGGFPGSAKRYTFFVKPQFATLSQISHNGRDFESWRNVSEEMIQGDWDPLYERMWQDNPVYQHMLPDKTVVKVGYSPTQSTNYPERELWFVILHGPHGFIVDKEVAQAAFINAIGSNYEDWIKICWCHLEHECEALLGGLHTFELDSPWSVAQIDSLIEQYRQKIAESIRRQHHTGKKRWGLF